jgi:CRP-like cAMP-binding protein
MDGLGEVAPPALRVKGAGRRRFREFRDVFLREMIMPESRLPFQLDAELWEKLKGLEEKGFAREGAFLFRQGDSPKGAFLLLRGSVALSTGDHLLCRNCLPGCLLGLPATVRNKPYSLTAECLEDCEYVRISHEALVSLLESNPQFCMRVVEVLANEVGELRNRMPEHAGRFNRITQQLSRMEDWSV